MNRLRKTIDRAPVWALTILAAWHAALGITALTVVLLKWDSEFLDFAAHHLLWAAACGYVAYLIHENDRLRRMPLWQAADDAFRKGYIAGSAAKEWTR